MIYRYTLLVCFSEDLSFSLVGEFLFKTKTIYYWVIIAQKHLGLADQIPLVSSRPIGCVLDEGG